MTVIFRGTREVDAVRWGDSFKVIRENGNYVYTFCEPQLLKKLGYTRKQLIGKTLFDVLPMQTAIEKQNFYTKIWEGQTLEYEIELEGKLHLVVVRPIYHEGFVEEAIGVCFDLNHKKRLQTINETLGKLIVKQGTDYLFISCQDIVFLERKNRKTSIYTKDKEYIVSDSLSSLMKSLDASFILSHRSFIINIKKIEVIKQTGQSYEVCFKELSNKARISKSNLEQLPHLPN